MKLVRSNGEFCWPYYAKYACFPLSRFCAGICLWLFIIYTYLQYYKRYKLTLEGIPVNLRFWLNTCGWSPVLNEVGGILTSTFNRSITVLTRRSPMNIPSPPPLADPINNSTHAEEIHTQTTITLTIPISDLVYQKNCYLTTVDLTNACTSIGDFTFYHCASITSIRLPEGCREIGWSAFNGCGGLRELEVGGCLRRIGNRCFMG